MTKKKKIIIGISTTVGALALIGVVATGVVLGTKNNVPPGLKQTFKPNKIQKEFISEITFFDQNNSKPLNITSNFSTQGLTFDIDYQVLENYFLKLELTTDLISLTLENLGFSHPKLEYSLDDKSSQTFKLENNVISSKEAIEYKQKDIALTINVKIWEESYQTQEFSIQLNILNKQRNQTQSPSDINKSAVSKIAFLDEEGNANPSIKPVVNDDAPNSIINYEFHAQNDYKLQIQLADDIINLAGSNLNFNQPQIQYKILFDSAGLFTINEHTISSTKLIVQKQFSLKIQATVTEQNYQEQVFSFDLNFKNNFVPDVETQKPEDINKSAISNISFINSETNLPESIKYTDDDSKPNAIDFTYLAKNDYKLQIQLADDIINLAGSNLNFNQPQIQYKILFDSANLFYLTGNTISSKSIKNVTDKINLTIQVTVTETGYKTQVFSFNINFNNEYVPDKETSAPTDVNKSAISSIQFLNSETGQQENVQTQIDDALEKNINYKYNFNKNYKLQIQLTDDIISLAGSNLNFNQPVIQYSILNNPDNLFSIQNNTITSNLILSTKSSLNLTIQARVTESGYKTQVFSFNINFNNEYVPDKETSAPTDVNKSAISSIQFLNSETNTPETFQNSWKDCETKIIENGFIANKNFKFKIELTNNLSDLVGSKLGFNNPTIKYSLVNNLNNLFSIANNTISSNTINFDNNKHFDLNIQVDVSEKGYKSQTFTFELKLTNYYSKAPTEQEFSNPSSYEQHKTSTITAIGIESREVLATKKRTRQTQYYDSSVWQQYHDEYNFIYPGYNRNYEMGNNRYFTNSKGNSINGTDLVYAERNSAGTKYNDPDWIKQEIQKGTLKKHRAADNFFANDISNIDAQTVKFNYSTAVLGEYVTGLYAPPGEVVTISFDKQTTDLIKNMNQPILEVVINDNFWDNYESPDTGQISNRYPFIESSFVIKGTDLRNNSSFKFGSPFGGSISIKLKEVLQTFETSPINLSNLPISFTIDDAIPCLFYQHNVTTEAEWKQQLIDFKNNKIAPVLQATSALFSLNLPSTNKDELGHYHVDELAFPKQTFDKWNDFMYVSNMIANNDQKQIKKLNMEFCDDIWKGAGAWGGSDNFYCPTGWGVESFLLADSLHVFQPSISWGILHEINHNYQQNDAFFNKRSHGETNQVTIANIAMLGDNSRLRSELNWTTETGSTNNTNDIGWARISSPYIATKYIRDRKASNKPNQSDEYPIYAQMLFNFGPQQYIDYIRWDAKNHPSSSPNWSGIDEIKTISEHFKTNYFPAFFNYEWYWSDWTNSSSLSSSEREIVNEISRKYKAVDFVSNLFATGIYTYNSVTNQFVYGGDFAAPYEVLAGQNTVFDLNKFIISTNDKFNWNNLKYPSQTPAGASLSFDSSTKKLTYSPNPNRISDIDEFDISIVPGNWSGKPTNYVPEIKFKIKIRQVVNQPELQIYNVNNKWPADDSSRLNELENKTDYIYNQPIASFNTNQFIESKKQGAKIKFKFVVPESGLYKFNVKWADAIKIKVNGNEVFKQTSNKSQQDQLKPAFSMNFNQNQVVDFEIHTVGDVKSDRFDFKANLNDKNIDLISNSLIPNYENVLSNQSPTDIIKNDAYKYKTRKLESTNYQNDLFKKYNLIGTKNNIIEPFEKNGWIENQVYSFSARQPAGADTNSLLTYNSSRPFLVTSQQGQPAKVELDIQFVSNRNVSSLYFGHDENYPIAKPTHIKITGYPDKNSTSGAEVLYEGEYGAQFNDKNLDISVINFNKQMRVGKIKIEATNTSGNQIAWNWIRCSEQKYNYVQQYIFANSSTNIKYTPNWEIRANDAYNTSLFNGVYAYSNQKNNAIELTLKDAYAFNLYGQVSNTPTKIDIYIDDQKMNIFPIELRSDQRLDNHIFFSHTFANKTNAKIKIVHLDDNPFYFNFATVY